MTTIVAINGAAGNHGRNQRVPGGMAARDVRIGALVDPDLDGANEVANWIADPASTEIARGWGYDVPDTKRERPAVFADVRDIPESLGVQLVIDAGPSPTHFETARYCLGRGWAANPEKPATMERAQARELAAIAQAARLPVAVGYPGAWALEAARIEILEQNAIGAITSAEAEWHRMEMYRLPAHFYNGKRLGVGPDLLGHVDIPLCRVMGARPVIVVRATGSRERGIARFGPDFLGYDTIEAELLCDNGADAFVRVTWGDGEERPGFKQDNNEGLRFKLEGTAGRATYHAIVPQGHSYPDARDFQGEIVSDTGKKRPGAIPLNYQDAIVLQTENAAAAAAANDPGLLLLPLSVALHNELVVHAIGDAIETGAAVPILS